MRKRLSAKGQRKKVSPKGKGNGLGYGLKNLDHVGGISGYTTGPYTLNTLYPKIKNTKPLKVSPG